MTLDRILLWRHGRTEYNAGGRFQGQLDVPLDRTGVEQAREAAPYLAAENPSAIYSSDLSRAMTTARALSEITGVPITADVRLRETDLGGWQGLDRDEVREKFPEEFNDWVSGVRANPGNGESAADVARRAGELLGEVEASASGTVVFTAHGGALKALTASLLRLPADGWALIAPLRNCHWTELRRTSGQWRLVAHNVYPLSDPAMLVAVELNVDSEAAAETVAAPKSSEPH